jgi:trimethylamine--corrinoid protein Co-methyltransferase
VIIMLTQMRVLSDAEREQVHERTAQVLADIGMRVDSQEARRLMQEAGATVDEGRRRVRIPRRMLEESLRLAPKSFSLGGRREGWELPLNAGRFTLLADGGATRVYHAALDELREPTQQDWVDSTRLQDAIDDIGLYWSMVEVGKAGMETADYLEYFADLFRLFTKHAQDSFDTPAAAHALLEVLDVVFGGRDEVRRRHPFSFLITPASPLVIEGPHTDAWLELLGWDIPVAVMPMPLMGATAPGSLLATLVTANAETLGTLCLIQAAEPGTPFIYAPVTAVMEPRTGRYFAGAIEGAVLNAGATEMARWYRLPVESSGGGTDQYVPGVQAAYEKAATSLLASLAWPDILVGPGLLAGATVYNMEQLIIDVEVYRLCRRAMDGVDSGDERWLTDVMEKVGPGGTFLGQASTRRNVRDGEWCLPQLGFRDSWEAWGTAGRPDIIAEARQKAEDLLATHAPAPLGDDVERELEMLARQARSR